jgi:hypothetical protein
VKSILSATFGQQPLHAIAKFFLAGNLFSQRMFYLGRENSVRFHSQLREAATRYRNSAAARGKLREKLLFDFFVLNFRTSLQVSF